MPRPSAARHLTPRDRAILHWIGSSQIASARQLHQRFWAGGRVETAQARLRQLVQAGYLTQHHCDAQHPGELVYTLTPPGRRLFPRAEQSALYTGLPAAQEIRQQLLAQDAYLYLAATATAAGERLVAWQGERVLRRAFYRARPPASPGPSAEIPDAQAVIAAADGATRTWDIEIDGHYHGRMLRTKLARFGAGGRPTLWVCASPARAAHIRQAAASHTNITVLTLP